MEHSRTITRPDGATIGYRISRDSQPQPLLVMIHGLASNLTRWSEFVDHTTLHQQWDLLRLDLRGHGCSMYHGKITMDVWCDDLAAVMQTEGYDKAVILGHSLGAQLGMHFHAAYPEHLAGLIMIDPVFPENLGRRLLIIKLLKPMLWFAIHMLRALNKIGLGKKSFPLQDLRELDEQTRKILDNNPAMHIGQLYINPLADLRFIPLVNYLQDAYEITRKLPPLENIGQPVLVLLSAGATVSNPEKNQAIIGRIANVQTVSIDANHWLLTEKPREARAAIEKWCNENLSKIRNGIV